MVRDRMIAIGIAFWGFLTSSPAVWKEKIISIRSLAKKSIK
jgi:hypothetical protein